MLLTWKPLSDASQDRNCSLDHREQVPLCYSEGSWVQGVDEDRLSRVSTAIAIACDCCLRREAGVCQYAIPGGN
jgi:hypothetical protein